MEAVLVRPSIACLLAMYRPASAKPITPPMEALLMIEPPGRPPQESCMSRVGAIIGLSGRGGIMAPKSWQDWVNAILGLYLFVSLSILGGSTPGSVVTRDAWILCLPIAVLAAIAANWPRTWEEAVHLILGICLLASPWGLSYIDQAKPAMKAAAVGLLVIGLAIWAMLKSTRIQKWWHERHLTR